MNGSDHSNGVDVANPQHLSQLAEALDAIHDPRSSNAARKDATIYLEQAKSLPNAASIGFELASSHARSHLARHYGLSLLEYTIRYKWESLDRGDSDALRQWTVQLANGVVESDPIFLRNKIAQLWLELAKKSWLDEWEDMDQQLVLLWGKSYPNQAVVLQILELLSEDAFDNDDVSVYIKGGGELRRACIETFTSSEILTGEYPERTVSNSKVRYGDEGWFLRLLDRLRWCLENFSSQNPDIRACTIALLQTLRSMMPWMFLKALHGTGCVDFLCRALQLPDLQVQLAALEVLHSIFHRTQLTDEDVSILVFPVLSSDGVALLRSLYASSHVDIDDIDDSKYLLSKKLTELMCALGCFLEQRPQMMAENIDIASSLDMFLQALKHQSLVVSIPIIYLWTRLLACKAPAISSQVDSTIATLLEISSQRLLRYESLPAETDDATYRFLNEDFDTMPERHAFVGNYRRFCSEIVERVVRRSPFEAMRHILTQADGLFSSLDGTDKAMSRDDYNSSSFTILRVDAQCTVISSALKGYLNWLAVQKSQGIRHDESHESLQQDIEQWCQNLLKRDFADPIIHKRILQLVSEFTTNVLKLESPIPLAICDHVLSKASMRPSDSTTYGEAIKELQSSLPRMIQKLAMRYCDEFMKVYSDLENGINTTIGSGLLEQRTNMEYRAILLIIVHRTKLLTPEEKHSKLSEMIEPTLQAWRDPELVKAAESFEGFCTLVGLDGIPRYFLANNAHNLEDWSSKSLDDEGLAMRERINTRPETLPLQPLKCFLTVSTDRIHQSSVNFTVAEALWEVAIPVVLPTLLQLLSHAHAFGNPAKWSQFPEEMQVIIRRTLVDRVWQAGISSESRDDFFNRIRGSKTTLEGLASATRAAIRGVRELSYWILHCLCQFSHPFFKHEDLAEPLARALYEDAHTLSSHQVSTLLRISMALLDACPPQYQDHFLPPLLSTLFRQVDQKLTLEWEALDKRAQSQATDETLDQEMKTESVLRQLTYSAVSLASSLLNPQGPQLATSKRNLVLRHSTILSSLILFANHALRMRDTRSCAQIIRALRAIIPDFNPDLIARPSSSSGATYTDPTAPDAVQQRSLPDAATASEIREYFSHDVLQSAITSLHEPYFADLQKDLAALIAAILVHYAHATDSPRAVLLSLPGIDAAAVDAALSAIRAARSERLMRAEVLRLLEGLRGVSIHEMGRVRDRDARAKRPVTRMQEQYMSVDGMAVEDGPQGGAAGVQGATIRRGGSAEVEGVAELFG